MTTTTTRSAIFRNGLAALQFSRKVTDQLLEDFPESKMTFQPVAHANHALWQMGHLAVADDTFLAELGKRERQCPEEWKKLFDMGSEPVPEASAYPPAAEVRKKYTDMRQSVVDWFSSMSDDQLNEPLPEGWESFGGTYGGLMSTMACHDGMHAGQLTVLRKALGLEKKFG